jgi:hypothetical protein
VPGTYLLRLRLGAFIVPLVPVQTLHAYIGEFQIGGHSTSTRNTELVEIHIESELFAVTKSTILRLRHPYAARPSEHLGYVDERRIAFSFRRLTLARIKDSRC